MVRVLYSKGYTPRYTLVEYDKVVLQWAVELLDEIKDVRLDPVCADAKDFMAGNTASYDLIFVDVFIGRVVPDFVTTREFLRQCRQALAPNGRLAFNYIINDMEQWQDTQRIFTELFPVHTVVKHEVNRIFITG
ncbi:MAG: spermine synthase [Flavipsychrobacter sp.]|nr:spermine synthase [Flavipsychrobacter sp.]